MKDYSEFKEPCALCDNEDTTIESEVWTSEVDPSLKYDAFFIRCGECGFEFVNEELGDIIFENKRQSKMVLYGK